ncbi:MAG: hypothetical protein AVDCRST_MAG79-2929 [uncultured Thermoleophilia bacterium]|uniref:Uncharacterized protein n=1 Tax=uncultured Thermoleophilia bacterium TaxID=1497501 RepID=A0A6J4ULA4_9ACTN|nr:MAG: hypothetical protein AVDCRST_MAG79-2929 [uncultured Thermoleophilia bacterium]
MSEHASSRLGADDGHLDGNAAGGLLRELFAVDVTAADATCASCATTGPVGALVAYGHRMGAVLRCPRCAAPVLRVVRTPTGHWLDLSGARVVRVRALTDAAPPPA